MRLHRLNYAIDTALLIAKEDEDRCAPILHEAYRSVLGAVALIVPTRAELAVYVQAQQRRAQAPRITDLKMLNVVIRYTERHKCGLKSVQIQHPVKFTAFTDAAFKATFEEATGLVLRGLAAVLIEDNNGLGE